MAQTISTDAWRCAKPSRLSVPMSKNRLRSPKPAAARVDPGLPPPVNRWWPCLLIAALVLLAFLPALNNGFVQYDDPDYVSNNPKVQEGLTLSGVAWAFDPATIVGANWHPLTMVSHLLDCQLYGLAPFGHHLTSVLLHVLNSVLLFIVLRRMTGALWCSLAVAVWFGVHPAHVESVAWVSERKDVLSGLFWMLTLLAYHEYTKRRAERSPRTWIYYALALVAFLLGLLAKPMLVTLPFVLLLLDYWPLRRLTPASWRPLLLEKVPFFALTIASSVITFLVQKKGGAMELALEIPLAARVANAVVSYLRYVGMLFWPTDLTAFYPFQVSWPIAMVVGALGFVAIVSLASLWLGKERGYWPVGWFWFFGTLVPVIGLVQVGAQSIADRYTYLPSIGLFIAVAWAADDLRQRWRVPGAAVGVIGAVTALACVVATRHQIGFWRDGETLFRRILTRNGDHYMPHVGLGSALIDQRRYPEAIAVLERARELDPKVVLTYLNLCAAYLAEGRAAEAVAASRQGTRLAPKMLTAWSNLGRSQMQAGETAGAVDSFQKAVALAPKSAENFHLLGLALRWEQRFDEANAAQRRALELQPDMLQAREQMIKALILKGDLTKARMEWRTLSGLMPGSLVEHNSFGVLLAEIGRIEDATKEFEAAHRIAPNDPDTKNNLARAYEARSKTGKAEPPASMSAKP